MNKQEAVELVKEGLKAMVTSGYDVDGATEDTKLIAKDGWTLDSFGMTTLILELENIINTKYDKNITIMGDQIFSVDNSPFRTVGTLAEFLMELIK